MSSINKNSKEYIEGIEIGIVASWKTFSNSLNITPDVFVNDVTGNINKKSVNLQSSDIQKILDACIEFSKGINFTDEFVKREHDEKHTQTDSCDMHNDSNTASFTASFMAIGNNTPAADKKDVISLLYNDESENDNFIMDSDVIIEDAHEENHEAILDEKKEENPCEEYNEADDIECENSYNENDKKEIPENGDIDEEPQKHSVLSALRTFFSHDDAQNELENNSIDESGNNDELLSDWNKAAADIDKELEGRVWGVKASEEHIAAINETDDQLKSSMTGFFEKVDKLERDENNELIANNEKPIIDEDTSSVIEITKSKNVAPNDATESIDEKAITEELDNCLSEENEVKQSIQNYDSISAKVKLDKESDQHELEVFGNHDDINNEAIQLAPEFFNTENEKESSNAEEKITDDNNTETLSEIDGLIDMDAFEDGRTSVEQVKKTPVSDVKLPSTIIDE